MLLSIARVINMPYCRDSSPSYFVSLCMCPDLGHIGIRRYSCFTFHLKAEAASGYARWLCAKSSSLGTRARDILVIASDALSRVVGEDLSLVIA